MRPAVKDAAVIGCAKKKRMLAARLTCGAPGGGETAATAGGADPTTVTFTGGDDVAPTLFVALAVRT